MASIANTCRQGSSRTVIDVEKHHGAGHRVEEFNLQLQDESCSSEVSLINAKNDVAHCLATRSRGNYADIRHCPL